RDRTVTGVQTCALPIFASDALVPGLTIRSAEQDRLRAAARPQPLPCCCRDVRRPGRTDDRDRRRAGRSLANGQVATFSGAPERRSEERRVGKEGSTRRG